MYWTHLIFALLHGLVIRCGGITASKPGYLDFDNLPETNFSCDGKVIGGYYADVETGCQMFHVCTIGQKGEVTDIKFLCLNGTVFDQETRVCERIDEVDCSKSEDFFGLNLELYGNNANFGGIQAENEFEAECEECSTDEEYEESEESTTLTSTTSTTSTPSTTTTTTTTTPPSTSSSQRPNYQGSSDTIQALLALHSAFNQGLQGKPPPPRVINNAFSPTPKPALKPYPTRPRPPAENPYRSRYTPDSQSYGSLNLQQRERPYYFTPATEKSNYHHFHSGDTSFGHSFDATRPYNFQYFHSRKLPEVKPSVSVVTSTSTSTSVKTSKGNSSEYPTGYEDYQDDFEDHAYFEDVPKLRQRRGVHTNHKYAEEEVTTQRHRNHKYDEEPVKNDSNFTRRVHDEERTRFLQNLLGSIDLDEQVREKMTDFFEKEDQEIDEIEKEGNSISDLGNNKIGQVFTIGMDSKSEDKKSKADKLSEWAKIFEDMKKDINLNYKFELNFTDSDSNNPKRRKRDTRRTANTRSTLSPSYSEERTAPRRTSIDTEKFQVDTRRKKPVVQNEFKPVSESIEDDFTTVEWRRSSKKSRSQPSSTTSLRAFTFNYELTTAMPDHEVKHGNLFIPNHSASKEIIDFVHEEVENASLQNEKSQGTGGKQIETTNRIQKNDNFASRVNPNVRQKSRVAVARRVRPSTTEESARDIDDAEVPVRRGRVLQRGQQPLTGEEDERAAGRTLQGRRRTFARRKPSEASTPADQDAVVTPTLQRAGPTIGEGSGGEVSTPRYVAHRATTAPTPKQEDRALEDLASRRRHQFEDSVPSAQSEARQDSVRQRQKTGRGRGAVRNQALLTTTELPPAPARVALTPDPGFSCDGKVKGGFYADTYNDCRAFFICSQGEINGPLLKTHFACGDKTKFNQRSRTCQAEDLVECEISSRYYHLNNDFLVPVSEDELRGDFEPMKQR